MGWRGWAVARDELERVWLVTAAGPQQGAFFWPKFQRAEAECADGNDAPCSSVCGGVGHGCGFYASRERTEIPFSRGVEFIVVGTVKLWGRVNEHAWGYRAQYAYPFELRAVRTAKTWRATKGLLGEVSYEYGLEW